MKNYFLRTAKVSLVLVYLVIVAGALVRMTGSGMGCPDWPKCFGYYIPPTDVKELLWAPNRVFEKGQVIIKDEKLLVANSDFTTPKTFDASQWRPYTKHDYAIFDATETWIEYINRLIGAVAGLAVFIMAVLSLRHWKTNRKVTLLSWFTVFLMGFQGWLGARVVYSVLNPIKITIHMVVALIIVGFLLYIIKIAQAKSSQFKFNATFRTIAAVTLVLTLVQIIFGTQVRQYVDDQVRLLGYDQMHKVLANPDLNFYVHRSFSIAVLAANFYLWYINRKFLLGFKKVQWIMAVLVIEIISGIAMYYLHFPFSTQAFHLVLASILFGLHAYLVLESQSVRMKDN